MTHSAIQSAKSFLTTTLLTGAFLFTGSQAFSQTTLWSEDFESYPNGTTTSSEWTLQIPGGSSPDYFEVRTFNGSKWMEAKETDGDVFLISRWIHVTCLSSIEITAEYDEEGSQNGDDCIEFLYSVNGGPQQTFSTNGEECDDFSGTLTASTEFNVVPGDSIQITVRIDNDGDDEIHRFDNIEVVALCAATNVDLVGTCPLDIIFVLDESGSIGGAGSATDIADTVREAVAGLANALIGTGTRLAIVEFDAGARRAEIGGSTTYRVVNSAYLSDLDDYLNGSSGSDAEYYEPGGLTNWDQALDETHDINVNDGLAPLVIMFTDGKPTTSNGPLSDLQDAIVSANVVKNDGSHIFVVAVPNPTIPETNVQVISGLDKFPTVQSDFNKADYSIRSSATLVSDLEEIASFVCIADYDIDCGDNEVEIVGSGTQGNASTTLNFTNTSTIDSIVVELVFKGGSPVPTSTTFSSSSQTITVNTPTPVINNDPSRGVFRTTMNAASSITATVNQGASNAWSFIAYVFRSGTGNYEAASGFYTNVYLFHDEFNYNLPLPVTTGTKDLTIIAPVTEMTADSRICKIIATAGSVVDSIEFNTFNQLESLNLTPLVLTGVGGSVTNVHVRVLSPNSNGDSFLAGSTVKVHQGCAAPPTVTGVVTDVDCHGECTGAVNLTVTDGNPPFTFSWTGPGGFTASTEDINNLCAGTYTVTVSDNAGFNVVKSFTVNQPSNPIDITLNSLTDVDCFGDFTGAIDISVSGGTPSYTYSWTGPGGFTASTQDISNLGAGTYNVTVTDSKSCSTTKSYTIQQPSAPLSISLVAQTNVNCFGDATGALDISVSGGTPAYTYSWTGPGGFTASTQDISGLVAGVYNVTVTDSKNCTDTETYTITQPSAPLSISLVAQTNVNCFGDATGALDISVSGGTPAYTYSWTGPGGFTASTQDISGLVAGVYNVTVTDSKNCTDTETHTITQPSAPLSISLVAQTNVNCFGDATGALDISVSGGTPGYTYSWTGPGGFTATTQDISGLVAGVYNVTVTDSKNCTDTETYTITQPSAPVSISLVSLTHVQCSGLNTGAIDISVAGGTPPYSYSWTGPAGFTASTQDINNLIAGVYNVTVTDDSSCTETATFTVNPAVNCNNPPLARDDFNNTLVNIPVSGNVLTNDRDPDGDNIILNTTPLTPPVNGSVVVNADGSYTYTPNTNYIGEDKFQYEICDDGVPVLCDTAWVYIEIEPAIVGANRPPIANPDDFITYMNEAVTGELLPNDYDPDGDNITINTTPLSGPSNGSVVISATGQMTYTPNTGFVGEDQFEYIICDDGTPGPLCDTTVVTIHVLPTVTGNRPPVAVDDAYFMDVNTSASGNILDNDYEPDGDNIVLNVTPLTGPSNGSVTVNASGAITYTPNANYVGPDNFTYVICDDVVPALCDTATVYLLVAPVKPCLTHNVTDVSCFGYSDGAIDVTVTCGAAPFTYAWSNGATTEDLTGIPAGTYSVTVSDLFGNEDSILNIVVNEPTEISVTATVNNAACLGIPDGSIDLTVSGGTPGYTYNWSGPGGFSASTEDITGLDAGLYLVTITDANNCFTNRSFIIGYDKTLDVQIAVVNAFCSSNDGSVDITVSGGSGNYGYMWSGPGGFTATTEDISNLFPGTYTVTVTDSADLCQTIRTAQVDNVEGPMVAGIVTDATCNGSNGSIDVTVTGIAPPYLYLWSPGGQTTEDISNLTAGIYSIQVTDTNGCVTIETFTVGETNIPQITGITTDAACNMSDGSIDITVTAGSGNYSYSWSNGANTEDLTGIPAGTYVVVVTDNITSCVNSAIFTISEVGGPVIDMTVTQVTCAGFGNGSIDLTISGGTGPYGFTWSNGATTEDLTNLQPGIYAVTVTDSATGCTADTSATITEPAVLDLFADRTNVTCFGDDDGAVDLTIVGGTAPYTILWTGPGGPYSSEDIANLIAGTYTVLVTDANGCTNTLIASITQPSELSVLATVNNAACLGIADGSIDLTVSGGTPGYTYNWSGPAGFSASTEDIINLDAGLYLVTITDANNCVANRAFIIGYDKTLDVQIAVVNAFCNNNDGSVDITVSGGSGNYGYMWSGPGGFTATTEDISNLFPGLYTVTVTDSADLCQAVRVAQVDNVEGPTVTANVTDATCNGSNGSIDVTVVGVAPPYLFLWAPGGQTTEDISNLSAGIYTVQVTDTNGCVTIETFTVGETNIPQITGITADAACNMSDGSIDITVTAGSGNYSYSWSNGANTEDLTGIPAGTYVVVVTDNITSCVNSAIFTISEVGGPVIDMTVTQVTCAGFGNGSIDLTISGGTGPYGFTWSNGATTEDLTNLQPGIYAVTVTDSATGCVSDTSATITEPAVLDLFADRTNVSCFAGSDGAIDLLITGGTAPYNVLWAGPGGPYFTEDLSGLVAGTYTVIVSDANSCINTLVAIIGQPTAISISGIVTNENCLGNADGSIDVTVGGGTPPYVFAWADGATTEDRSGLTAGTYKLVVTDANNCVDSMEFTVGLNPPIDILATITDVSCGGAVTGAIDITVVNGTAPYTFLWTSAGGYTAATEDISGLEAGVYTVFVTDATGCTATEVFTVVEITDLEIQHATVNSTCGNADGSITLTVSGGTGNYTYAWTTGGTSNSISGVGPGMYSVTVTDTVANCSKERTFILEDVSDLVLSALVTDASCVGSNGSIDLSVSGGSGNYSYLWSNLFTTQDISNLAPGTYSVTVTDDSSGCQAISEWEVTDNGNNNLDLSFSTTTDATCGMLNGSIDLTVSFGSTFYTFMWSTGATTEDISGLAEGVYSVSVTDLITGCSIEGTFVIGNTNGPAVGVVFSDISCAGSNDGSINITVTPGSGTYTYLWSNGATTEDVANLAPGTYYVEVTDSASGCITNASATISEPAPLDLFADRTHNTCDVNTDGEILITVVGGTSPYTYLWSTGATTKDLLNLGAGSYTLNVTDANLCTNAITVDVLDTVDLVISAIVVDVSCNAGSDGEIDVSVSGGNPPYTYLWSDGDTKEDRMGMPAGDYTVTVTDATGCQDSMTFTINESTAIDLQAAITHVNCPAGSTGEIDLTVTGGTPPYTFNWTDGFITEDRLLLSKGLYGVTVTDAAGCEASRMFTIDEIMSLTSQWAAIDPQCGESDGSIDLTVLSGSGNFTFAWSNGATTEDISGLSADTYIVFINDTVTGCQASDTVDLQNTGGPELSATTTAAQCASATGSIDLTVVGTGPFGYAWSFGAATTEDLVNVPSGSYKVTVTDSATGCISIEEFVVAEENPLMLSAVATPSACGGADGSLDLTVGFGSGFYLYNWSSGDIVEDPMNLVSGTYCVTITDQVTGCQATACFHVGEVGGPQVAMTVLDVTCAGSHDGSISVTASGGSGVFEYLWSNGATTSALTNLGPGLYIVTVSDSATMCETVMSATVGEPAPLDIIADRTHVGCVGLANGAIDITVIGGTGAGTYTYLWDNAATTEDRSSLDAGTFCITVTDGNGCTNSLCIDIVDTVSVVVTPTVVDASCFGFADGSIDLAVSGGVPPYTYTWSNGLPPQANQTGLAAGTYMVTVMDSKDCIVETSIAVGEATPIAISPVINNVNCAGGTDGSITLTVTGGTGTYTYNWSNGTTLNPLANVPAGVYHVTVTDSNGCEATGTYTMGENSNLDIQFVVINAQCGLMDGSIDITAVGGSGAYTYAWAGAGVIPNIEDQSNLGPGIYNVTVTDGQFVCVATKTIQVDNVQGPDVSGTVANTDCIGTTGAIDLTVTGSGPYTYEWTSGGAVIASTKDLNGQGAGTYYVKVTDVNGCVTIESFEIKLDNNLTVSGVITPTGCLGTTTGSIQIAVFNGSGNYSYLWSNGETTQNIANLGAGTYSVLVTDLVSNCMTNASFTVSSDDGPVVTITTTDITCAGALNGYAEATVVAGTVTYEWSTGATTSSISGLSAGTYYVTVTEGSCITVKEAVINDATAIDAFVDRTHADCYSAATGAIDVRVVGGTPPYAYNWDNGATTEDISGLAAGTYCLTIKDVNECEAIFCVDIAEPDSIDITASTTNAGCNGQANGTIDLEVTGGTTPYTYAWSGGLPAQQDHVNVASGSYDVTVTDANGCTESFTVTVDQDGNLDIQATVTPVECTGGNTGSIALTVSGGTGSYSYAWYPAGSGSTLNNLAAGTYSVTVTDNATDCKGVATYVVDDIGFSVNTATINATCGFDNGEIHLTVAGGSGTYTYTWDGVPNGPSRTGLAPGTYNIVVTDVNSTCQETLSVNVDNVGGPDVNGVVTNVQGCGASNGSIDVVLAPGTYTFLWFPGGQNTEDIAGLVAGDYKVSVTDANGCVSIKEFTVAEDGALTVTPNVTPANCGMADGAITVNVSGGVGPYNYSWSTGDNTQTVTGLLAGSYIVVIDDLGSSCSATATIHVGEVGGPQASATSTDVTCASAGDGSIDVTVVGSSTYSFAWSDGDANEDRTGLAAGSYIVTITDDTTGCKSILTVDVGDATPIHIHADRTDVACNGATSGSYSIVSVTGGTGPYTYAPAQSQSNLSAGTVTVSVTDANGCVGTLDIQISEPDELAVQLDSISDASCAGIADGSIQVSASGGTMPYTYDIGSGPQASGLFTGLAAGTYNVTVTDANGCTEIIGDLTVGAGMEIMLNPTITHITCDGANSGSIILAPSGGTGSYTYNWAGFPGVDQPDLINLSAGVYLVTVTDDLSGCFATGTFSVIDSSLNVDVIVTSASCGFEDGSIKVEVNGGSGSFSYAWSVPGNADTLNNLPGGVYTLTVTDLLTDCEFTDVIVVPNENGPMITGTVTNATCVGDGQDGSIDIEVAGGFVFTYAWSHGPTTQDVVNLPAGTYFVTVTTTLNNAQECESVAKFVVLEESGIDLSANITDANCGENTGEIILNVSGSTNYTAEWSTGDIGQVISNLAAGTYAVTVTDIATGCTEEAVFAVGSSNGPSLAGSTTTDVDCAGASDGSITLNVSGGTAPYTFNWSDGSAAQDRSDLQAGTYVVEVTDADGCKSFETFTINEAAPFDVLLSSTPDCPNTGPAGTATAEVRSGGTGPYTYAWSGGGTGGTISGLIGGFYTVTVTDANGCVISGTVEVKEETDNPDCVDFPVLIPQVLTPNGDGVMDEWNILNIGEHPDNEVFIFNRWGDMVFNTTGYNNTWKGEYMDTNNLLPDGTYYYVVELNGGDDRRFQGFVVIHR